MAAPFFQGNMQDLLSIAGQGQGSYLLGQMMNRQRQEEEAKIKEAVLGNLAKQQELDFNAQMNPYKIQEKGATISNLMRTGEGMDEDNARKRFDAQVRELSGGPQAEAAAKKRGWRLEEFKSIEALQDYLSETMLQTPWSPNIEKRLMEVFNEVGAPPELATPFFNAARGGEKAWNDFQNKVWTSMKESRKIAQQGANTAEVARIGATSRENVAKMTSAARIKAAGNKSLNVGQRAVILADVIADPETSEADRNQAISQLNILIQFTPQSRDQIAAALAGKLDLSQFGLRTHPAQAGPRQVVPGQPGRAMSGQVGAGMQPNTPRPDPLGIR